MKIQKTSHAKMWKRENQNLPTKKLWKTVEDCRKNTLHGNFLHKQDSVDSQMTFFSPDTDVLVLVIANYDRLPRNTFVSMVSNMQQI